MPDAQLSTLILDAIEELVALLASDGVIVTVNAAWGRMARAHGNQALFPLDPGANYLDICRRAAEAGDVTAQRALAAIQAAIDGRPPAEPVEYPCDTDEGVRWYAMRAARLAADDPRVVVSYRLLHDVKQAERREQEMLAILSRAEEVAHIGSWKWDFATNHVTWSDEMFRIFGVDPATFDGDLDAIISRAIHPDDRAIVQAANRHVLTFKEPAPLTYRILWPSGEVRTVYGDGRVVYDDAGRPSALLGSIHDRTELARAETALKLDDRRLNALFELSEQAYTLGEREIIQLALEQAVALTSSAIGYLHLINADQETIQLYTWSAATLEMCEAVHDSHYPVSSAGVWADCIRTREPVFHNDYPRAEGRKGLPEGHTPLFSHLGVPVLGAEGQVVVVVGVGNKAEGYNESDARQVRLLADSMWKIVQRTRADAWLRLQGAALEAAVTPIVITDDAGVIAWVNPAFTKLTGYAADEVVGQNPRILKSGAHPPSFYAQLWDTISAGSVWHGELINRRKDGQCYDEEQAITPVRDGSGRVAHYIAIKQDISERKQREREQQARAALSEALGAVVAHADMLTIIIRHVGDLLATAEVALVERKIDIDQPVVLLAGGEWRGFIGQYLDPAGSCLGDVLADNSPCIAASASDAASEMLASRPWLAALPLRAAHEPFGALVVGRAQPFSDAERHLLVAVAEIASNMLHRATLHEATERHLRLMQSLHRIDKAISSGIDMEIMLSIVLDEMNAHLVADAIAISRMRHTLPTLERVAARGFLSRRWPQVLSLGDSYAGQVALRREPIYRAKPAVDDDALAELMREEGFVMFYGIPLLSKGQVKGVLELFARKVFHGYADGQATIDLFANQLAIALDSADMVERLQRSHAELMHAYETTIEGWSRAMDLRDKETEGHSLRVTEMTLRLAQAIGVSGDDLVHIRRGALLHDIGKIGVPDHVLLKPGPLTDAEWEMMRKHPVFAHDMLAPIAFLAPALAIPYCHHERYDGTGYPRGLRGEQIPLAARIFSVVDVWDALRSDRPYRAGWPEEQVFDYIRRGAGAQFDPYVVERFLAIMGW